MVLRHSDGRTSRLLRAPYSEALVLVVAGAAGGIKFGQLEGLLVLSPSGNPIGKVLLPRQGRLLDIRHRHIVVGERDEDDVERIAVYALTRGT